MRIQLLTFPGCPLADAARRELESALEHCGLHDYEEIDLTGPSTPDELRAWGSPTILIDGKDVAGEEKGDGLRCRVYATAEKVPTAARVISALKGPT